MRQYVNIKFVKTNKAPKNILAGAISVAIEKAERFGTPMVIKRAGKILEVSPAQMKKIVSQSGVGKKT